MDIKKFAFWLGVLFLVLGVAGFFPALVAPPGIMDPTLNFHSGHGRLFGIFPINTVHNLIHIAFGIWGIVSAKEYFAARFYCRVNAIAYALLALMGLFPVLNTVFGLTPLHGGTIWLHAMIAVSAGYYGYVWSERESPRSNTKVTVR